jgi:hypothetical protein
LRVGGPGDLTLIGLFARCAPHGALATHCGTTALRRLLRHSRKFAFLVRIRDDAAFNRESFTCVRAGATSSSRSCRRPPTPFGWEGLHRTPQALTFSVATWLDPESFRLVAARLHVPASTLRR